ncbi:MAG: hypothetical protein II308_08365, partial [Muribaculaceae bacterium]|nr:hypothetical protein [Muribaculaceae bacterium]
YRYTLTVRGWVASFRVDGYKQATPKNTKVTIDLTAQSYVNAEDISSVSDSSKAITVQFNKGTNKSNGPKWYDSGKAVRLYGGNYMTISAPEGQTITSIQFAYGSSDGSNEIIADSGSFTSPTWTGAANSVKFTIAGTSGHRRFAQIYVTYGEANPEWAPKFNDVANGGVYYNSVQYNITAPGAEKMDIVMNKNGANYWSTSTTYIPWYNGADVGEWEIIATAFKGNEFTKTTINFTVEEASAVYFLNEFIGTTGKKYYKFNNLYVLAQGGQYLYVKDDTRCILIYGNSPKFNVGDCFQELVAEYKDYNGQHELIAYQFGQVWGNYPQQPEVVTINDVTVANQSKYVKIENVALNAEAKTIGGVTFSNRFNTELPVDGNYTVTAIIGMSQGTPRLEPITFEEYQIEPFTYTEIVPADKAEVTSLSEIKITFPYDVTYDASVTMGVLVMDGGNMITPTVAVEGNVATLTFDAITAYGSKPSLMVMEGAFKEATSGVGCQQIMAAWSIPTPPIVPTYVPTGFNPADGSEVEKIGTILIYTDDAYPELSYNAYDDASKCVTVYDAQGNVVEGLNQLLDYASVSGGYAVKYMPNKTAGITEPGTYTFKFAEGTFGDETYYEKNHKKGRVNPEFTITYTIKAAALAAPTVDPANGAEVENPSTVTLTFAEAVTVNAEAGELTMVNTGDPNYDKAKNFNVTISEDGLTATITSEPGYLDRWATNATYKLNIPAGYFVGASGAASEALEYTWKVVPARFTYTAVTPAQGDVENLETIFIDFGGFRPRLIDGYTYPTYNLVNANGETVTTAATDYTYEKIGDNYYYKLKVTLGAKVTTPGDYFLTIPAGVFKDKDVFSGYNENAEMTFKWTVMEPDPNTYDLALAFDPANGSTLSELKTLKISAADPTVIAMPTTEAQSAGWFTITDANGNTYNYTAKVGVGIDLTIEGATEAGTYTVVVPAKSFVDAMTMTAASKRYNAETVLTYTVEAAPAVEDYTPVVTPAAGEVTALEVLNTTIALPAKFASFDKTIDDYYNEIYFIKPFGKIWSSMLGHVSVSEDGLSINITWDFTPEEGAEYTLVIPAGNIVLENGAKNLETQITYTIKAAEVVEDFTPVVSPAAGEITVDQMNETVITFDTPIASFDESNVRYIKAAGGNVWFFGTSKISEDKLTLTLDWELVKGNYPVGTSYTLDLPAGCIVLENGAKNLETRIDYTLVAPDNTVYDYAPVNVSPANGSEVESLEKIYVTFPYGVYDCLWAALEYGKDFIKVSDENGNTYEAKIGYGSYTEDYYIYVKDATALGKYTIVVPKGLVFDEEHSETFASGHANPEFTLTYTLVVPVVEDFTPVVNPAAGNVTKEQIKTTVLSFESPIASFDNSDVRYAKNFGSVWCSVAGSYTIAEDKLSLTINWDFSPEVGLNYTLELPAGCIVLENGAKNLFTQVAYTVVAGPKDLAEFVVPAGMNGYVNYDETDVNAWAPEFPFTVSTTAYNTVAFAAELPSLPAGITAMEVIDENGEVIAILNQDGVAPLADGEIYYVKGETTKEYADGAELKFRFRFTHLGVSETIQFSYIVAGGNITSIADVELDGNVIVRGNDIIAPEGAAIFTVSGIRVPAEDLTPGVYVVVLGNQAVKVMVK